MAPFKSDENATTGEAGGTGEAGEKARGGRRKAARYVVPVTVVGVAAATIGLVPAFAGSGDPDLPSVSAQELIEKIAASDVQQLSGTVKISTDLGLPDLDGLASGLGVGGATGGEGGSSADPSARLTELASGTHTLRVAADGPDKQKLSLLDEAAEYSVIHNGDDVWAYDSGSNEVFHATGAADGTEDSAKDRVETGAEAEDGADRKSGTVPENVPATPEELAEEALKAVDDTTSVTVDGTAQVAGRDAYKLLIEPKQADSTVGAISVAVDAETGLPLKFTLTPAGGGAAVVDAGFTEVDFSAPSAATFDFTPPKGAKVTEADDIEAGYGKAHGDGRQSEPDEEFGGGLEGMKAIGEGWSSIAAFDTGAEGLPTETSGNGDLDGLLGSFGDEVSGKFGSGTVFSTRLVNVLITDDGKGYAGAVTKDALVKAANADR
ncbi:LolA family protein [Streptomyces poonensis]|nr:sigma-E factor regulatory protein RseB domain-containing protein [Streptomyces poonensis]